RHRRRIRLHHGPRRSRHDLSGMGAAGGEGARVKVYLISLGAGLLVGIVYSLINVRSPAPPVVALIGLLGMLAGEQIVPIVKHVLAGNAITAAWLKKDCGPHVLGELPGRNTTAPDVARDNG